MPIFRNLTRRANSRTSSFIKKNEIYVRSGEKHDRLCGPAEHAMQEVYFIALASTLTKYMYGRLVLYLAMSI